MLKLNASLNSVYPQLVAGKLIMAQPEMVELDGVMYPQRNLTHGKWADRIVVADYLNPDNATIAALCDTKLRCGIVSGGKRDIEGRVYDLAHYGTDFAWLTRDDSGMCELNIGIPHRGAAEQHSYAAKSAHFIPMNNNAIGPYVHLVIDGHILLSMRPTVHGNHITTMPNLSGSVAIAASSMDSQGRIYAFDASRGMIIRSDDVRGRVGRIKTFTWYKGVLFVLTADGTIKAYLDDLTQEINIPKFTGNFTGLYVVDDFLIASEINGKLTMFLLEPGMAKEVRG